MEAETLKMGTGVNSDVYVQPHLEVLVDDMKEGETGEVKLQDNGNNNDSGANLSVDPQTAVITTGYWPGMFSDESGSEKERSPDPLPVSDRPLNFNNSNSSLYTPTGPIGITISPSGEVQEIYLRKIFVMPENHEFYCPNCRVCINKVLFCEPGKFSGGPSIDPSPPPRPESPQIVPSPPPIDDPVRCSECFGYLVQRGKDFFRGLASCIPGSSNTREPADPVIEPVIGRAESRKGWEILKSIVYGGLAQLLASLSVVTSAASADATTMNIVALGTANLIGGLFVLAHNLRDLKASKPREGRNETEAAEDKYNELLGKRENYFLHSFFAILSFFIFGLVPPIVYGFSFHESNDKDLKLAAVAGASVICIALLATAKAYTERPNSYMTYFKTITFYVTSGVLAVLLTSTAGDLVKWLIEQLGWSEGGSGPNSILSFQEMRVEKLRLGTY